MKEKLIALGGHYDPYTERIYFDNHTLARLMGYDPNNALEYDKDTDDKLYFLRLFYDLPLADFRFSFGYVPASMGHEVAKAIKDALK